MLTTRAANYATGASRRKIYIQRTNTYIQRTNTYIQRTNTYIQRTTNSQAGQRVRVVKETDSKSVGLCPREFKSRRCRFWYHSNSKDFKYESCSASWFDP